MPHVAPSGRQLSLIDVAEGPCTDQERFDLPEYIAALEREVRYYRRLFPVLTRCSVKSSRPSPEQARELTPLARWLTDGTRMIGSLSQAFAEQRQLEVRLEALERAHHQLRDEVAELFDDDPDERTVGAAMLARGWVRAGLVALIVVIVAIVSVPYFIDWWQAMIQRHG
jgi:hypothetical protein